MTRHASLFTICCLLFLIPNVTAWWDYGHMLPLAILRYRADTNPSQCALKTHHIEKIEKLLNQWRNTGLFPMSHDAGVLFEFLGPLPDYIKWTAGRDNQFDRGINDRFYNELHYFNQQFWLDKKDGTASDIENYPKELQLDWGNKNRTHSVTGFLEHLEKSFLNQNKDSTRWTAGTFLFQFAYYVHMMSDFHNPVHVGGSFAQCYLKENNFTDLGANKHTVSKKFTNEAPYELHWSLTQSGASVPGNLHALWDSMAWYTEAGSTDYRVNGRTGYFGGYADDMIKGKDSLLYKDAKAIMDEFSADKIRGGMKGVCELDSFFKELTRKDFQFNDAKWMKNFEDKTIVEMAMESDEMNRLVVYGKALQNQYMALKKDGKTCPASAAFLKNLKFDDTVIKAVNCISRVRVLLASYRLEKKLAQLIDSVDVDAIVQYSEDSINTYISELRDITAVPTEEPNSASMMVNAISFVSLLSTTLSLVL